VSIPAEIDSSRARRSRLSPAMRGGLVLGRATSTRSSVGDTKDRSQSARYSAQLMRRPSDKQVWLQLWLQLSGIRRRSARFVAVRRTSKSPGQEVVPGLVEVEGAVPGSTPAVR
jgi:hypothetical protein